MSEDKISAKLREFLTADSIDPRKLQLAYALADMFRIGPNPPPGVERGLDEQEFLNSLEAVMGLQVVEWDTPLPISKGDQI